MAVVYFSIIHIIERLSETLQPGKETKNTVTIVTRPIQK